MCKKSLILVLLPALLGCWTIGGNLVVAQTNQPSDVQTKQPSDVQTKQPSDVQTNQPSDAQTKQLSGVQTKQPSSQLTAQTNSKPSRELGAVGPVPDKVRKQFDLDPFYEKYFDLGGLPVVGSKQVSDEAILEAAWIVDKMVGQRPEIITAMANNNTRLAVMAYNEFTTDVPEHRHLRPKMFWDRRARGLGATRSAPAVSCAEENLLCHPNDPYSTENICIHEFAHAIHEMGMVDVDPDFNQRLKRAFDDAMANGRWKNTYAASNHREYWAEATQSWFDNNRANDSLHNDIDTRQELIQYDPAVARLCEQVYGNGPWRYLKPMDRQPEDQAHLQNINFEKLPRFEWRKPDISARPQVRFQTDQGDFEIELDAENAPQTVANFLDYVHEGFYTNGQFHRTVTAENQPQSKIKIEVIQASADPKRKRELSKPIVLERTRDTGIKHLNGTISMARSANPNSARDEYFICIGDQPELDFGGKRNPDGQGFAAFGKVTKGMDVIQKIHQSPAEGQNLEPAISIQRAVRLK